jgi:hypothetical protein
MSLEMQNFPTMNIGENGLPSLEPWLREHIEMARHRAQWRKKKWHVDLSAAMIFSHMPRHWCLDWIHALHDCNPSHNISMASLIFMLYGKI